MSNAEQQATAPKAKLQREQCYLIMMRPVENPKVAPIPQAEMRLEHHDYLVDMERRGILFAAGPLRDDEGWERGYGLLIFRASNRAEATNWAMQEPYTKYGQREVEIIPWQRNEGTISINLRLADGFLEIDNRKWAIGPAEE